MKDNKIPVPVKRKHPSNRIFSDNYAYTGIYNVPTEIRLTCYNQDVLETTTVPADTKSFKSLLRKDCINWIEVNGMNDSETITRLVKCFGLTSLDLRDILTPGHVVKIDVCASKVFLILNSCYFSADDTIQQEHIGMFVIGNTMVTFTERESEHSLFNNTREALRNNVMNIRKDDSGVLLGFLINSFLSVQIFTSTRIEEILEGIEHFLLEGGHSHRHIANQIQGCRHAHLIIQKNILPLEKQFQKLLTVKTDIIDEDLYPIFDDLSDELEYAIQTTNNCKEILESLVDLYISQNDFRTNAIMKHLTVLATFFIPVTFLAGLWGMNFKVMPELDWEYGYIFAWLAMLATVIITWYIMKRKHWF